MRFPARSTLPTSSQRPIRQPRASDRAVALVTVLGILAVMTVLIMAMFTMAQTEQQGARAYEATQRNRLLADMAVNTVVNQIRSATRTPGMAWASQPGAIRRYDQSGNFHSGYKLYSSPDMLVEGGDESAFSADAPPSDWNSDANRARYVDLNSPVFRAEIGSGEIHFPIVDPRAVGQIEGFDFDASAVSGASNSGESLNSRLPMPVQWLYVLEDGTMGSLNAAGRFEGRRGGEAVSASRENPIIGRMAFWADDESAKVNINTASEPTFWDSPRSEGDDRRYANYQPVYREFQRYPGHPATTALSPVLFGSQGLGPSAKESLYELLPRVGPGGSSAATVSWVDSSQAFTSIALRQDRLYSTADEFLFSPQERVVAPLVLDLLGSGNASQVASGLSRRQFFLTAASRAPELNLFNLPRIAVWPIADESRPNSHSRTTFDEMIRFAARIGIGDPDGRYPNHVNPSTAERNDYVFRRKDEDMGYGDFTEIRRNQELYRYLQELTRRDIPGFGGNFLAKYGANRDQIITQIYDYIRCINLFDDSLQHAGAGQGAPSNTHREFTDSRGSRGFGKVTPTVIPDGAPTGAGTMGMGRFFTVSEVALHFICNADAGPNGARTGGRFATWDPRDKPGPITYYSNFPPLSQASLNARSHYDAIGGTPGNDPNHPGYNPANWNWALDRDEPLQNNQRRIQMMVLAEFFAPMHGYHEIKSEIGIRFEGLEHLRINGETMVPATNHRAELIGNRGIGEGIHERRWGGSSGFRGFLASRSLPATGGIPADNTGSRTAYRFVGIPITVDVDPANPVMQFTQTGDITMIIDSLGRPQIDDIQRIQLRFPNGEFPVPRLVDHGTHESGTHAPNPTEPPYWWSFHNDGAYGRPVDGNLNATTAASPYRGRLWMAERSPRMNITGRPGALSNVAPGRWLHPYDTVRTVLPWHGDYRLTSARPLIDESEFQAHPKYHDTGSLHAHNMMVTHGAGEMPGFGNTSTPTQLHGVTTTPNNYHSHSWPDFPAREDAQAAVNATRDFDNGLARVIDGPYLNKPDEGNVHALAAGEVPYYHQDWIQAMPGPSYFTPNRQIPSAGMFGSLPTGVKPANGLPPVPWRTLLFRPQSGHFGETSPHDHLWLDLFWMPVVEPYAVSEPFSTAGKVNLNYAMMPFSYIRRDTGLRSVIGDETLIAIPSNHVNIYKVNAAAAAGYRSRVDLDATLSQFDERLNQQGRLFRTASQICEIHLVPEGATLASMRNGTFWNDHRLTGDNSRERPYANLYPRLTTKSNTYRIHYRVQTIRKARSTDPETFVPDGDALVGEDRGSVLIERYINPNRDDIPNYAKEVHDTGSLPPRTLDQLYEYRIVNERRFAP